MQMKAKWISIFLMLAFAVRVNAGVPEKCPSVSEVQSAGLTLVNAFEEQGTWIIVGASDNQYDTQDHWSFVVSKIDERTANEAFQQAVAGLTSLSFTKGPVELGLDDVRRYGCLYATQQGYQAVAVTPPWVGV